MNGEAFLVSLQDLLSHRYLHDHRNLLTHKIASGILLLVIQHASWKVIKHPLHGQGFECVSAMPLHRWTTLPFFASKGCLRSRHRAQIPAQHTWRPRARMDTSPVPPAPRDTRPARRTYSEGSRGKSKSTTCSTCAVSIPREARSVQTSTMGAACMGGARNACGASLHAQSTAAVSLRRAHHTCTLVDQ